MNRRERPYNEIRYRLRYGYKRISELIHKAAERRFYVRYGVSKYYARLYRFLRHNYTEVVGFLFESRDTVGARVQKREHFGIAFSEKVGAERVSFGSVLHIGESRGYFVELFFRGEPLQVLEGEPEASKGIESRLGSARGVVKRGRHFFNGVCENVGAYAALVASVHPPLKLFAVD